MASIPCAHVASSIRAVNRLSVDTVALSGVGSTPLYSSFRPSFGAGVRSSKRALPGSSSHTRWNVMAAQVEKDNELIMEDDLAVPAALDPNNPGITCVLIIPVVPRNLGKSMI